ncbi:DUF3850 domain-containing protein [Spirosoma pomorum]
MATHVLKTRPEYFDEVFVGNKSFELRKNDRNYQKGDILHLKEYDPETDTYSGRETKATVHYIISQFGLDPEFCCMSIRCWWWQRGLGDAFLKI